MLLLLNDLDHGSNILDFIEILFSSFLHWCEESGFKQNFENSFLKQILLFFKNPSPLDAIQVTLLFVFRQTHAALDFEYILVFNFVYFMWQSPS